MRLTRNAVAVGITALSLAVVPASPAFAKHGGDGAGDGGNNTVVFVAPGVVLPTADQLKDLKKSGGDRCRAWRTVSVDPITGATVLECTSRGI